MDEWAFDVDPRFVVDVRRLGGAFYSVQITDNTTGRRVPVSGGDFLTGRGSVRRAVHYATDRYLGQSTPLIHLGGPRPQRTGPTPAAVWLTAGLAYAYAAGLTVLALVLLYDAVTDSGFVAAKDLTGRAYGGVVAFGFVLLVGSAFLVLGGNQVRRGGSIAPVVVPLLPVAVFGVIGEVVDSLGSATVTSDLIGLLVIAAAVVPLLLLATPGARRHRSGTTASTV